MGTYHVGMALQRRRLRTDFSVHIDVMVATIALTWASISQCAHRGSPGLASSIEAYYQEIGRAGRDGAPSRATLLQSYIARKTHEFFRDRDYPELHVLQSVFAASGAEPCDSDELLARSELTEVDFSRALEKLWIHGGVVIDGDQRVKRGAEGWQKAYAAQRAHRDRQLEDVTRFAEGTGCRMTALVRHFGDKDDAGATAAPVIARARPGFVL